MRLTWLIAGNDLRVFLKDKGGYVWLFIMPLVFIYLFGTAMTGGDGKPREVRPEVTVINQDDGYLAPLFVDQLKQQGFEIIAAKADDTPKRTITIPPGFTADIESANHVDVTYGKSSDAGVEGSAMVELRISRAILNTTSGIFAAVSENETGALVEAELRDELAIPNSVELDTRFAGRRRVPSGFDQSVPGYLVMFVLMNLLIFGGLAISQERNNGVLRRLAISPASSGQIIVGKILGRFLLGVVQIVYLLLISRFVFGMDYAGNLPLIALTMSIFAWGCAATGVLAGATIRNPETVQGVCTLGAIVMAAIGGCWWPLEIVPDFARQVGNCFPTAWAMNALHQLISFGGGFADIQFELLLISGFAVASSILAARSLR